MTPGLESVTLVFNPAMVWGLAALLTAIMFAIALDLTTAAFQEVARAPKTVLTGLVAQWIALPLVTAALIWVWNPVPSVALGLVLVAVCPGGPLSNYLTYLARGNLALSVALTAIGSLLALVLTPLGLVFWGGLVVPGGLPDVRVDPMQVLVPAAMILGAAALGVVVAQARPQLAAKLRKPLQRGAMGVFGLFILAALFANLGTFEWGAIELIVLTGTHLGLGLLVGWGAARIAGCATADRRSVMFETGIQNSGLALVIAFAFFGGASGTVLVPALWGLWQAWLGGALALVLRRL